MSARKIGRAALWMRAPMLLWALAFVGATLGYVLVISFLTRDSEGYGVVAQFTLDNYRRLLNPNYLQVFWQSVKLAFHTTVICLLIGYPFGYLMARASAFWRSILMLLVIVPFWTNALVRIYGWKILLMANGPINNFLMAIGLIDAPLKLLNTYGAVLLGMVYALIPFMILPVYTSVEKLDWSVVEAGRDLGAGRVRAFFTVTLPLTAPGVMAGCVLVFVPSMGLFFISDLLGGATEVLAGSLIRDQLLKSRDWPFAAALSMVLLVITCALLWVYARLGGKSSDMTIF